MDREQLADVLGAWVVDRDLALEHRRTLDDPSAAPGILRQRGPKTLGGGFAAAQDGGEDRSKEAATQTCWLRERHSAMAIATPPRTRRQAPSFEPPLHKRPTALRAESSFLEVTLLMVVVVVIATVAAFVVLGTFGGPGYQVTIQDVTPYSSSEVIVAVQVRNLARAPATPKCVVDMSSPASAYTGEGTLTAVQPIPAGSWATYRLLVPVTAGGADSVGIPWSSASCY